MLFVLVGGLLLLFGLTGRYLFNPRRPSWLVLAVIVVAWGIRTWLRSRRAQYSGEQAIMKIGGTSLALAGAIMIALAWVPFQWAGWLLMAAGVVFVIRGLLSSVIAVRSA